MLATLAAVCLSSVPFAVLAEEQRENYRCLKIEYTVSDSNPVRAYLLVPEVALQGGKCPAVLCFHEHAGLFYAGKEKLVRSMEGESQAVRSSADAWVRQAYDGVYFGDKLASLGYVVIAPDMYYWGERCPDRKKGLKEDKAKLVESQKSVYDSLMAQPRSENWAEKTLREDLYAAQLLASLDFVDKSRIGVFGFSMGAHRAWMLAASSPLVKTGVSLCWMSLKSYCVTPPKQAYYPIMIPRLREQYDFPDVALALRSRPFCFINATEDEFFPCEAARKAFAIMQDYYSEVGAQGKLVTEFFEGTHSCPLPVQERIISFFADNL